MSLLWLLLGACVLFAVIVIMAMRVTYLLTMSDLPDDPPPKLPLSG